MGKSKKDRSKNKRRNPAGKPTIKKKQKLTIQDQDPAAADPKRAAAGDDDEDVDLSPTPENIQRLLEPYTKDQLIAFLLDAAASDPALVAQIRAIADTDVSHRKVFVHGLGWDTATDDLLAVFQPFGPIEDCKVVVDKATGRAKGYGFVLFATRAGAVKALKEPQKKIKNRITHSQLASIGPIPGGGPGVPHPNAEGRRVYVSNVHADADSEKLKTFFSKFGEIEAGPFGFDMNTGKSRGFALFVYKTREGATKALEEPYKMFEGHQLHCQKATDPSQKNKAAAASGVATAAQQPAMAALAAAQTLALYSQTNPLYAAMLAQNPLLAAGLLNPAAAVALNPTTAAALNQAAGLGAPPGQGYGLPPGQGYGGAEAGAGANSLLGAYGSQAAAGLQGLQSYQGLQYGQSSAPKPSSSYGGYSSYFCNEHGEDDQRGMKCILLILPKICSDAG